ncbi:hypothetical protein ACFFSH_39575 [Streptomyces filamentosus]|uniref:Uncharacterized protein n=1 Tax=Streptomyces filamentosus TaxID=67294 RepID=A0A919EQ00_STRFL|nr:hypothetical protein [Streptomyces filamentosus]GHG15122.1 hypothetical protein GCM10017667_55770 [Streptomyces filamentosus]
MRRTSRSGRSPPTDALRPTYHRTRADAAALTAAIQPGATLYIHHDGRTHAWTVTDQTGVLRSPILTPADGHPGRVTLHQLLARYGAIHTQNPTERTPT